jgi:chromosome segregation ATPase
MGHDGSRLPPPLGPSPALFWSLFCGLILLLLLAASIVHGQTERPPELQALRLTLLECEQLTAQLSNNLQKRGEQVLDLQRRLDLLAQKLKDSQSEIESLQARLKDSEDSRASLEAELLKMQISFADLLKRYEALLTSWKAYQTEARSQIVTLTSERNAWKIGTFVAIAVALLSGLFAILK